MALAAVILKFLYPLHGIPSRGECDLKVAYSYTFLRSQVSRACILPLNNLNNLPEHSLAQVTYCAPVKLPRSVVQPEGGPNHVYS